MEPAVINSPAAAFVAGLVTSFHCAFMCGPLACWLAPAQKKDDAVLIASVYQGSRLGSYTLLGAVAGTLGAIPLARVDQGITRFLPWLAVLFFLAIAFRWERFLPRIAPLQRLIARWRFSFVGRSPLTTAAGLGLVTPLFPCGPLYFLVALAAISGSALRGMEFMLAFGLGTLPLLWLAQANFGWLRNRLKPDRVAQVQRMVALTAAIVIAWRLRATLGASGPDAHAWVCF